MRRMLWIVLAGSLAWGQDAEALLRAAMEKETVEGDLKAAIQGYEKALAAAGANRGAAAKALVRLGQCYEKQGHQAARGNYERVLREYKEQPEAVVEARNRLRGLDRPVLNGLGIRLAWADPQTGSDAAVSPDGHSVAFPHWGNGDLAVRDLASGQTRLLTHMPVGSQESADGPVWTADGKRLAYPFTTPRGYELRVIQADGSGLKTVFREAVGTYLSVVAWSPDQRRILVLKGSGDGEDLAWVGVGDGVVSIIRRGLARWPATRLSRDGRYIAFNAPGEKNSADRDIRIVQSDGTGERVLVGHPADDALIDWSADGRHIVFASNRTNEQAVYSQEVQAGKAVGTPRLLYAGPAEKVSGGSITRDGAIWLVMNSTWSDIYEVDLDGTGRVAGKPVALPTLRAGSNVVPRFSPDGNTISFYWGRQGRAREMSVFDVATRSERWVHWEKPFEGGGYCWAPENRLVLSVRRADGSVQLHAGLPSGGALTGGGQSDVNGLDCSRASGRIVYYQAAGRVLQMREGIAGEAHELQRFVKNPGVVTPRLSPDGRRVTFRHTENGDSVLSVLDIATGNRRDVVRSGWPATLQRNYGLAWSPDGSYVYYAKRGERNTYTIYRVAASGGPEENLGVTMQDLRDLDISPDGRRLVFSAGVLNGGQWWVVENAMP